MAISWRPLHLQISADAHLPILLISTIFEANEYTIHLTDLTHIWSESLAHAAILDRAEEEQTSIDPSDGSQLRILLEKLFLALSSGPDTNLSLHIPSSPGRARPILTLHLMIKLPGGLAPLEWPVHLSAAPQSVLTSQLTVPLIQAQYARVQEVKGLNEVLKEKDHVIQKLLDRLETQGTDLGQIFPQATARGGRKVERKQVEETVRGLGPFDMKKWRTGLIGDTIQDTAQLTQKVFTAEYNLDLGIEVSVDKWWERVKGSTIDISNKNSIATRTKTHSKQSLKHEESTADNEDSQVQSPPPQLVSKASKYFQNATLDDSPDDDELDAHSQLSQAPKSAAKFGKIDEKKDSFKQPAPTSDTSIDEDAHAFKPKKFGKIGGKIETTPPTNDDLTDGDEPLSPKSAKKIGKLEGKKDLPTDPLPTEDEMTEDSEPKSATNYAIKDQKKNSPPPVEDESADDSQPVPPKAAKKFGKIGRKNEAWPGKVVSPPPAEDETTDDEAAVSCRRESTKSSPEPVTKLKRGLGRIGGKKVRSPSASTSSGEETRYKKGELGHIRGKRKEAIPSPASSQHDETPAKRKLGVIGGRNKKAHGDDIPARNADEDEGRGRSVKVEKRKTPPPRETSDDRAERKRRELKRELEEKAKAPAKKKRKF